MKYRNTILWGLGTPIAVTAVVIYYGWAFSLTEAWAGFSALLAPFALAIGIGYGRDEDKKRNK